MAGKTVISFSDADGTSMGDVPEISALFHRLNNKLGIILANAELLDSKLVDKSNRARAGQIVSSVIDAISTAQDICLLTKNLDN
jgi:hypothetical protein